MTASLVFVDASKNMDKYYILQLLRHKKSPSQFYVYNRWGRTGTGGQAQMEVCRMCMCFCALVREMCA